MQDRDLIISQIRQRLEILYQMIEELESGGGEPGSSNYNDLSNKPSINNVTLTGNKTTTQLGLASAAQINQTNTNVSNLTNTVNDIFTPDNITLNDGGFFPQIAMEWIGLHKPISVNDDIYYCIEETGVDYLYASIPTNGAYPSTSYLRIMKSNRKVEFHNTIIETTPTENSDNLVTSGGIYTALEGKMDTEAQEQINAIANAGAKNILQNTATSDTVNGITFTVNEDGSITATGTATANADFTVSNLTGYPTSGQYILSGCPEGGGANTYRIQIYQVAADYGEGVEFTSQNRLNVYIRINSGQTVNGLVFKPMIRDASITDDTYVPYGQTNAQLTGEILPLLAAFPYLMQRGAATLNDQSSVGFNTLIDTGYWRYTGSAIDNPVPGNYGIIIVFRYTAYAVQLLFSQGSASTQTRFFIRLGTNITTTPAWRDWQEVSTTVLS